MCIRDRYQRRVRGSWTNAMVSKTVLSLALLIGAATALPLLVNETAMCQGGNCGNPTMAYQRLSASQPGFQWDDAGGYCGSWASQRAILAKGAWISQQQVRDHTKPCGGHDNEILSCNIDEALTNLKIDYEGFDYKTTPLPQTAAYGKWLKKQLVSGYAVAWMILWSGQSYPIYDLTPPMGMYGHVEPVIGIQSNHPLNDTTVYDDDTVLHYNDGGVNTIHRKISSIAGTWAGPGKQADCGDYSYCIGNPYGFGWAVKGFKDDKPFVSASLHIDPWLSEPDTRSGKAPEALKGTVTATDLTEGSKYDIYRWDTVAEAFTYTAEYKKSSFTAVTDQHVYTDDKSFMSNGTTYYRVVQA
eukprot:TRINITY_DN4310_c0_g1_i1.p1 TRINITY_DN4310_c0_g1~~TRINITY_DN4310_c0_g1_i1.p1  ORF type:complete len:357 (-),score=102.69 TRINITY_DN4310_c0_g1_i1:138-1208(-)